MRDKFRSCFGSACNRAIYQSLLIGIGTGWGLGDACTKGKLGRQRRTLERWFFVAFLRPWLLGLRSSPIAPPVVYNSTIQPRRLRAAGATGPNQGGRTEPSQAY
jgi:hypothetical protein